MWWISRIAALQPGNRQQPTAPSDLDGVRVCFTGEAVIGGVVFLRSGLERAAAACGMQPVSGVSKKGRDLLVAAVPSSTSGKAQKARTWGIPIISVEEFVARTEPILSAS